MVTAQVGAAVGGDLINPITKGGGPLARGHAKHVSVTHCRVEIFSEKSYAAADISTAAAPPRIYPRPRRRRDPPESPPRKHASLAGAAAGPRLRQRAEGLGLGRRARRQPRVPRVQAPRGRAHVAGRRLRRLRPRQHRRPLGRVRRPAAGRDGQELGGKARGAPGDAAVVDRDVRDARAAPRGTTGRNAAATLGPSFDESRRRRGRVDESRRRRRRDTWAFL